jgi:hypothetical protein
MSCGFPSRSAFKRSKPVCQSTGPCAPCPQSTGYSVPSVESCYKPTDWIEYTPQLLADTTNPTLPTASIIRGRYKIVDGNTLLLRILYSQADNIGATNGTGQYLITLPPNITVPSSAFITDDIIGGVSKVRNLNTGVQTPGNVALETPNAISISFSDPLVFWSSTSFGLFTTTDPIEIQAFATLEL